MSWKDLLVKEAAVEELVPLEEPEAPEGPATAGKEENSSSRINKRNRDH